MKKLYTNYLNTFRGLSTEVWWLALMTFINRSGTMIIPFLSIYLREDLHISQSNVGWVMTCFGLGSVVGVWIGGKLTDKIGYYKVMVRSLLTTGFLFIGLQFLDTFTQVCFGIFLVMAVADTFRPAMGVAMSVYSKPENKTRSVTLIRLAINLGFSAGPAIGIKLTSENEVTRVGGVKYTIKDGVIYDAKKLLQEVKDMVDKEKGETNWQLKQPGIKY